MRPPQRFCAMRHQALRRPGEIGLAQVEIAERIAIMRVEARGDDDEIGAERLQARQDRLREGFAERFAAVARAQRRVDDLIVLPAFASRAGAGIERHLMGRGVHDAAIAPEDVLRAIAVVHVEIDDGDALEPMRGLGVARGDRGVVEETKTHRRRRFGVVSGRPRRDEGVVDAPARHFVHGVNRPARRAKRGLPGPRRHRGVRVELNAPLARRGLFDRGDVVRRDERASAPRSRRAARSRERADETFRVPAPDRPRADAAAFPDGLRPCHGPSRPHGSPATSSPSKILAISASVPRANHRRIARECPLSRAPRRRTPISAPARARSSTIWPGLPPPHRGSAIR